jgi:hypothetical protein
MKTRYFCYDCDESTASVMRVLRGRTSTFVHRTGTGCHKGVASQDIYWGRCKHAAPDGFDASDDEMVANDPTYTPAR